MLRVCPCTKFEGRSDPPYGSTCTLHAPEMMTEVFLPFGAVKVVRIVSDSRGKLPAWLTVRGRDVHAATYDPSRITAPAPGNQLRPSPPEWGPNSGIWEMGMKRSRLPHGSVL